MGRRDLHPRQVFVRGLLLGAALLLIAACADRVRRNPLDAQARDPANIASPLEALAGDGMVRLRYTGSQSQCDRIFSIMDKDMSEELRWQVHL